MEAVVHNRSTLSACLVGLRRTMQNLLNTSRECYRYLNPSGYTFGICNARQTNIRTYQCYANKGYLNEEDFYSLIKYILILWSAEIIKHWEVCKKWKKHYVLVKNSVPETVTRCKIFDPRFGTKISKYVTRQIFPMLPHPCWPVLLFHAISLIDWCRHKPEPTDYHVPGNRYNKLQK
jgi:hypothetical protein